VVCGLGWYAQKKYLYGQTIHLNEDIDLGVALIRAKLADPEQIPFRWLRRGWSQ
jgi:hypothetical protein